jgi:hypothetical protein
MNAPSYFEHNARRSDDIGFDLIEPDDTLTLPAIVVEEQELQGDEVQVVRAWFELMQGTP